MELRGNLRDFGLADIIQLVGFGRKTGALRVNFESGDSSLYFQEGNVVHAEFPGIDGNEAVFALFRVPAGEFRFQTDVAPPSQTIFMDPTNLVMEAARLLDESRRDGEGEAEWAPGAGETGGGDWFGSEMRPTPAQLKQQIRELLQQRFGRNAKRLLQAVDQCGDTDEELLGLAERVEKYVHVFIDSSASRAIGDTIRTLVSG